MLNLDREETWEDEDSSKYMAESIKEAEEDVKRAHGRNPDYLGEIKKEEAESKRAEDRARARVAEEGEIPSKSQLKKQNQMAEDMVSNALNSQTVLNLHGNNLDVTNVDS